MPRHSPRRAPLAATLVAVVIALAGGAATAGAAGPTAAQRAGFVRQLLAEGLQCAIPNVPGGVRVDRVKVSGTMVTATVSAYSEAFKKRIPIDAVFYVIDLGRVLAYDDALAKKIMTCAGQPECPVAPRRIGLGSSAGSGKPVVHYGPITVYGKVPGLKIGHDASGWIIQGIRVATKGSLWDLDCGYGSGRIEEGQAGVRISKNGPNVAAVGDVVSGLESTGCPASPQTVAGKILTGDSRITINGHPVAVTGSRVEYLGGCASVGGTVK